MGLLQRAASEIPRGSQGTLFQIDLGDSSPGPEALAALFDGCAGLFSPPNVCVLVPGRFLRAVLFSAGAVDCGLLRLQLQAALESLLPAETLGALRVRSPGVTGSASAVRAFLHPEE